MKLVLILLVSFLISLASSNLLYSLTSYKGVTGKQTFNAINPNVNVYPTGIELDIQYQIISTISVDPDTLYILCSSEKTYYLLAYKVTENIIIEIGSIPSSVEINLPTQQVIFAHKIAYIINNSNVNGYIQVTILNFMNFSSRDISLQAYNYVKGSPVVTGINQYYEVMYLAYTGSDNSINAFSFNASIYEKTPNETIYSFYDITGVSSNKLSMIFNDGNAENIGDVYLVSENEDGSYIGCKIIEQGFRNTCQQVFNQQVFEGQPKLYNPLFISSDYQSLVFLCQNRFIPAAITLNILSINNEFSVSTYKVSNIWQEFQTKINVVFAW
ncbi:hypothetical protein RB653_010283 [Dictyostelium firmibasis]|uniref:Transmembrane protein n=1 Tax=Dictyostelium firmibasis TaxID=79012 RepID=A0AAN7U0V9_9MYCE